MATAAEIPSLRIDRSVGSASELALESGQNRLLVLVQWAWSYLSYERGARLITGPWRAAELAPPK